MAATLQSKGGPRDPLLLFAFNHYSVQLGLPVCQALLAYGKEKYDEVFLHL